MRKGVLEADNEPTDDELEELMKEVAEEARRKGVIANEWLAEQVREEIRKAQERWVNEYE